MWTNIEPKVVLAQPTSQSVMFNWSLIPQSRNGSMVLTASIETETSILGKSFTHIQTVTLFPYTENFNEHWVYFGMWRGRTVWPDVGIKSSPMISKIAQKVATAVLTSVALFKSAQKFAKFLGCFVRKFVFLKRGNSLPHFLYYRLFNTLFIAVDSK